MIFGLLKEIENGKPIWYICYMKPSKEGLHEVIKVEAFDNIDTPLGIIKQLLW